MPNTRVILFQENDGSVPMEDWMDGLSARAQSKVLAKLQLLEAQGHELRRPHADVLRDGIYELRTKHGRLNLRVLYFFHKQEAVILSHGITKQEDRVPDREIDRAIERKRKFLANPKAHTFEEDESDGN